MVQFMSSENNNVWQLPEPEAKSLAAEEYLMYFNQTEEDGPLHKRWKPSPSSQTATQQLKFNNNGLPTPQPEYHPLNEPSPLGLRLRKSPSLLELAQKRLNQGNTDKADSPDENLEAETKRDSRPRAKASGSADKLKASHFPALLLRIGRWEYVSKHEGDLVAKCYFSKHKIVWEFLDAGLKKKFEINWADIVALKANYEADGFGTFTVVLDKPPHFFNEINPQPRKHTQWRATSDFTDGEASTHRQHFLQCAQGMLDKHYEKLIHCDTRLNFLSQQQDIVLDFPYFPEKACITNQDMSGNSSFDLSEIYSPALMTSPSTLQTCSSKHGESSSLGFIHQDMSKQAHSSNPVMSMDLDGQKGIEQMKIPYLPPTVSVSDLVNHIGNGRFERKMFGNLPFSDNVSGQENPNDTLENISQILLGDSQMTAASDERTLMSRVNSLCSLLQNGQQDGNVLSTLDPNLMPQQGGRNYSSTLDSNLIPANRILQEDGSIFMSTQNYPNVQQDGNNSSTQMPDQQGRNDGFNPESNVMPENETQQDNNASESNEESGMTRKDSYTDLLQQLPRIASLPRFLFDISENGDILL